MGKAGTERAQAFYDTVAASYAQLLPAADSYAAPLDLAVLDHFLELLGRPAGAVLDAGCGTGRMTGYLRERSVPEVDGVDLSPKMIEQARAAYPGTRFAVGDLAALPYADARFHGVLAWYSIIHTAPDACGSVLAELGRVLGPDGHLLLAYQAGTGQRTIDKAYGHDVTLRAYLHHTGYLRDALGTAGFDPVVVVDRAAQPNERSAQGFLIARRRRPGRKGVKSRTGAPDSIAHGRRDSRRDRVERRWQWNERRSTRCAARVAPTTTMLGVTRLASPGQLVELEGTAVG